MSCCEIGMGIACKKRTAEAERISESESESGKLSLGRLSPGNQENRVHHAMKPLVGWTKVAVMGVLSLQVCVAAFTQEVKREQDLGASPQSSPTGQTGAGTGNTGIAAANPGKADGLGNPRLGEERRPLYRLNHSDVVALSFTLSPEFDQTLTLQPDGYVALKDAGPVLAQGLTL